MMKKNGFVFVETIVAIVILTSSLLLLYTTFSKILQTEKTRVYYDNMNYVYRTWFIKNRLNSLNIEAPLRDLTADLNKYFLTVGVEYQDLFIDHEREKEYTSRLLNDFEVSQIIIVKQNKVDNLKKCKSTSTDPVCVDFYTNLSNEMINYFKTMYIDISCNYVMVIEYNTCSNDNDCRKYFSWVSI